MPVCSEVPEPLSICLQNIPSNFRHYFLKNIINKNFENSNDLVNILSLEQKNEIRVANFNIRSLNANFEEFRTLLNGCKIPIIGLTETWLKSGIPSNQFNLPNYKLIRNDRKLRGRNRGGGVAFFIWSSLKPKIILASKEPNKIEFLFVEVQVAGTKILLGVIYREPKLNASWVSDLCQVLSGFHSDYDHIVVSGDFNVDISTESEIARSTLAMINSLSFKIVPSFGTRLNKQTDRKSLIDFTFVSCPESVSSLYQSSLEELTDHDFICICIKIRDQTVNFIEKRRNINSINQNSLLLDALTIDWFAGLRLQNDADQKLNWLNEKLFELLDRHAPEKIFKHKPNDRLWINSEIKQTFRQRLATYRNWKNSKTNDNLLIYKKTRNRANRLVYKEKQKIIIYELNKNKYNSSKLWKTFQNFGFCKQKSNGSVVNCNPDKLNEYFTSFGKSGVQKISGSINSPTLSFEKFSFQIITSSELLEALYSLNSGTAGHDGLPLQFIKMLLPVLIEPLTDNINFLIMSCSFPSDWKIAKVVAIPKNDTPSSVKDYRPISLLPILSKAFESIMNKQITKYLEYFKLLNSCQSGYRVNHSTTTALVKIVDDI